MSAINLCLIDSLRSLQVRFISCECLEGMRGYKDRLKSTQWAVNPFPSQLIIMIKLIRVFLQQLCYQHLLNRFATLTTSLFHQL